MSGMPAPRTALDAAIERRVSVLYNVSSCFAAVAVASIIWSQYLIHRGPFPDDVKKKLLQPWIYYRQLRSYVQPALIA